MDLCWLMDSGETGKIKTLKEMELTRNIRLRRLQSVSQIMRMKDETLPQKTLKK